MSIIIPNESDSPTFPGEESNLIDIKGGQTPAPTEFLKESIPLVKFEEEGLMTHNMGKKGDNDKNESAAIATGDLLVLPEEPRLEVKHEHYSTVPPQPLPITQPSEQKAEESSPSSSAAASSSYPSHSPPAHSPHGQHQTHPSSQHPSYAHYYQHYPHGHAHYYYPHGAYYPPPPHHSGHQSYHHASHHAHAYYAHYPPPPGYYPPPHHYYYPQPPATTAEGKSTGSESGKQRSTPSPSQSKSSSPPPPPPPSAPSTSTKPYSVFSSPSKQPPAAPSTTSRVPAKTTAATNTPIPKTNSKPPQPGPNSNRSKRKAPETNAIFRSAEKRPKQSTSSTRAEAAAIAAKQAQKKEKARKELPKTVLDRRSRKNAQSRMRAAKLKQRITAIQAKDPKDRTPDEINTLSVFEERRQRKNGRSRERALERKREYERIINIPEEKWSKEQRAFVQETMVAKFKKNEGDRLRRKKLKDEFDDTTGSMSSEWENSTCKGSYASSSKKPSEAPPTSATSRSRAGIPDFIESTHVQQEEPPSHTSVEAYAQQREAPCTPVSQKEVDSLLESTPMNFFGAYSPNRNKDCFSPNFIFPSPGNTRDLGSSIDSIDFDSLELPTDGTSILDSSMAINIDDEVMYSPHLKTPTINNSYERAHHKLKPTDQHAIPSLSSKIVMSPLSIRKKQETVDTSKFGHDIGMSTSADACDFQDIHFSEDLGTSRPNGDSKAIAVSFSTDTI